MRLFCLFSVFVTLVSSLNEDSFANDFPNHAEASIPNVDAVDLTNVDRFMADEAYRAGIYNKARILGIERHRIHSYFTYLQSNPQDSNFILLVSKVLGSIESQYASLERFEHFLNQAANDESTLPFDYSRFQGKFHRAIETIGGEEAFKHFVNLRGSAHSKMLE